MEDTEEHGLLANSQDLVVEIEHLQPSSSYVDNNNDDENRNSNLKFDDEQEVNKLFEEDMYPYHWDNAPDAVRRELITLKDFAQQHLVTCFKDQPTKFDVPPSSLPTTNEAIINFNQLFFKSPTFNELEEVARDSNGKLKKLNTEQLAQVRKTSQFEVPSKNFPGQVHVWQLSHFFQKGSDNLEETVQKELSLALEQLLIYFPDRFFNDVSVWSAIKEFGKGLWKIPKIFFGVIETRRKNSDSTIDAALQEELTKAISDSLIPDLKTVREIKLPYKKKTVQWADVWTVKGKDLQIDLRLMAPDIQQKVVTILSEIYGDNSEEFNLKGLQIRKQIAAKIASESNGVDLSDRALQQRVEDEFVILSQETFFQKILTNDRIAQLSGPQGPLNPMVVRYFRMWIQVTKVYSDLNQARSDAENTFDQQLKKAHPIRYRIYHWRNKQILAHMSKYDQEHKWDFYTRLIKDMEANGYAQEAWIASQHFQYSKDKAPLTRKKMEMEREPIRVYSYYNIIWKPENWIIVKEKASKNTYNYHAVKHIERKVSSAYPFWRLANIATRAGNILNNSLYYLLAVNLWAGPFGIRAMFGSKEFYPAKYVDVHTGNLLVDINIKVNTFISSFVKLYSGILESRRKFEDRPDSGLIGKTITRQFNRLWNYFFKGFLGTLIYFIFIPLITVLNIAITVPVAATSILWAPLFSIVVYLWNMFIYDFEDPSETRFLGKVFPVIKIILWNFGVKSLLQFIVALLGIIVHPTLALVIALYSGVTKITRIIYDSFMFHAIVKRKARIPATNSFAARRVAGPGLSSGYYYQISPDLVLLALQAKMEQYELDAYNQSMQEAIAKPERLYRQFYVATFSPLGLVPTSDHKVFSTITRRNEFLRRRLRFTLEIHEKRLAVKNETPNRHLIRLTKADLEMTLEKAEKMVADYFPKVFVWRDEAKFWREKKMEEKDWLALSRSLLTEVFSHEFLESIEESDKNFKIVVDHIDAKKYASMLKKRDFTDPLEKATPKFSYTQRSDVYPTVTPVQPSDLSASGYFKIPDMDKFTLIAAEALKNNGSIQVVVDKKVDKDDDEDIDDDAQTTV